MTPRRVQRIVALVYGLLVVGAILATTLSPVPIDRTFSPLVGFVLFALSILPGFGWIDYGWLEWLSNVSMFVPLGVLLGLGLRLHSWWLALAASAAASLALEFAQSQFLPQRFASMEDVLANTLGGVLGFVVTAFIVFVVRSIRALRAGS